MKVLLLFLFIVSIVKGGEDPGKGKKGKGQHIKIKSDGTELRPHCVSSQCCKWNQYTKDECAFALCAANGYSDGKFVSASSNMCTMNPNPTLMWFSDINYDPYFFGIPSKMAEITAECTTGRGRGRGRSKGKGSKGKGRKHWTCPPSPSPTDFPTYSPTWAPTYSPTWAPTYSPTYAPTSSPTNCDTPRRVKGKGKDKPKVIVSDGTKLKPYCSWTGCCEWDEDTKQQCAYALCTAAGYHDGVFIDASNDMCDSKFAKPGQVWYWDKDYSPYYYDSPPKWAEITAECEVEHDHLLEGKGKGKVQGKGKGKGKDKGGKGKVKSSVVSGLDSNSTILPIFVSVILLSLVAFLAYKWKMKVKVKAQNKEHQQICNEKKGKENDFTA